MLKYSAKDISEALPKSKQVGPGRFRACCPAHDDHTPSLNISDSHDGGVLVHCFSGCTQDEVVQSLRDRGLWGVADAKAFQRKKDLQEYNGAKVIMDIASSDKVTGKADGCVNPPQERPFKS